ncbi:MAG: phosphatidylserine decarboxylase [Deltaproteobacteria bacterium]|nr:phosphatidylserine decarboxylase [Deltaproteobacteria bacterium]
MIIGLSLSLALASAYAFWRWVWFFRNPERRIPEGENILSPADGTVVYVERKGPWEPVISIKKNRKVSISDIVLEDLQEEKLLIGIFMSPFDVHYNRFPLGGRVESIRHHPAKRKNLHMTSMHWRALTKRLPIYEKSLHVVENERTVTKIRGEFKAEPISCYVVQIAGGSVQGIDSSVAPGEFLGKGKIFGMIRIGSQVDLVVPWRESMNVRVRPGQKVRAGETILVA